MESKKRSMTICATGSISAGSLSRLLPLLLGEYQVTVLLSKGATSFASIDEIKQECTSATMLSNMKFIGFIELDSDSILLCTEIAKKSDLLAIIPLSANFLGKLAAGIVDDCVVKLVSK